MYLMDIIKIYEISGQNWATMQHSALKSRFFFCNNGITLNNVWLNDQISCSELSCIGCNIFRTHIFKHLFTLKRWRCCNLCKNNFFTQIYAPFNYVEHIFVKVKLNSFKKFVLVAYYITSNSPCNIYSNHILYNDSILTKFNYNFMFLVRGDHNLPDVHFFPKCDGL